MLKSLLGVRQPDAALLSRQLRPTLDLRMRRPAAALQREGLIVVSPPRDLEYALTLLPRTNCPLNLVIDDDTTHVATADLS